MEFALAIVGVAALLYMTRRFWLGIVGYAAPLEFTAVAFTRETFRANGVNWREIPEPVILAIARVAIRASAAYAQEPRFEMARLIEVYVPTLLRSDPSDPDHPDSVLASVIQREAEKIVGERVAKMFGEDDPKH